ncbi:35180_t:CDS:2, partial [Gigaspora margarita]
LNKQKGLESSGKENRPVVSYSYKNTNNSNFSSEGNYYRESAGSSKASRSARRGSWSRGPSKEKHNKCYLNEMKKNILYKKLKKEAPNNLRSNKFDKNSASAILKKDVISLSRIYKSLKCQYKTTKAASLSVDIVADFNHQVREINEKYRLEIMLSFTIELCDPTDLKQNKFTSTWFRQAVITYADYTIWLANNKEQLKETLRVAEDFYILNNIQINTAKSKLLVINSPSKLKDRAVHFMHQKVQAGKRCTLFRFLGVWLSEKTQNMLTKNRAKGVEYKRYSHKSEAQTGPLLAGLIANLWQEELQPFDLRIWQNNLNCQIIYKAKELNLTIRHKPDFWKIHGTGPRFREVLEPKLFIKAHRSLQRKSCKGKAATWFSSIEKKYLTNPSNREISKGLSMYNPNNMSIMPDKANIKEDNRIKNWVLIEEKENSITIRQVVKKRKREVLVEHWQNKNIILKKDKMEQVLEKCSSCKLNSNKGKEVCLSWIRKEDIQGVYPKIQNVVNQKVLPVSKE